MVPQVDARSSVLHNVCVSSERAVPSALLLFIRLKFRFVGQLIPHTWFLGGRHWLALGHSDFDLLVAAARTNDLVLTASRGGLSRFQSFCHGISSCCRIGCSQLSSLTAEMIVTCKQN